MITKAARMATITMTAFMKIKKISKEGITHPFGDHRSVKQAFPSGIPSKESDPFLMCDYFDMMETKGKAEHEDDFPIGWHPHRGFDIATYLKTGVGRHADSLGNRETFATPGMQWISVGSGVEHAEGGATEKGESSLGFQIWVNVPSVHKMDDPDYGTVSKEKMPVKSIGKESTARVLAGAFGGSKGGFRTKVNVQMVDFEVQNDDEIEFEIEKGLDTALLYVYEGAVDSINGGVDQGLKMGSIVLFDADSEDSRRISIKTSPEKGAGVMLFAGKKLKEPIAWHGPIVMNTQDEIRETFREMRMGTFPPKRVDWDYKEYKSFPIDARKASDTVHDE